MIKGWNKADPLTEKKLLVEVDIPELLVMEARKHGTSEKDKALADWTLIAFYYLLRIGEYTVKKSKNYSKQTRQFKMRDVVFFYKSECGKICKLRRDATDAEILAATSASLKLDNQKNGHKGVCVHHHANGDDYLCPVKALARRYIHIRRNGGDWRKSLDTWLSACYEEGMRDDISNEDVSQKLKWAAGQLDYPNARGIPLQCVDTHSLRGGGANALSLAGYSDREIQKMGRWKGATFKEYIREELHCFSEGMSSSMKKLFHFVNVSGGAYHDVTNRIMGMSDTSSTAAA